MSQLIHRSLFSSSSVCDAESGDDDADDAFMWAADDLANEWSDTSGHH